MISSGRAGSVISTPSSVVTPVYVPVRRDTPASPHKNTLGPDQREVIYLFVGYTKELILTTLIKTENLHLWFCNLELQHAHTRALKSLSAVQL